MRIEAYDLYLDVLFDQAVVDGVVTITVEGSRPALRLDAAQLEVTAVRVDGLPAKFDHDGKRGVLTVHGLPQGRAKVEVAYRKRVSDHVIFGLYKSKFEKDYFLATDLEPAEARTVFPCKDHPAYKAVFKVKVVADAGLKVISNAAVRTTRAAAGGRRLWVFEPTPRMSTYLFFLGVGRFEESRVRAGRTEVVAAARSSQAGRTKYILGTSTAFLKDCRRYFGIEYPLSKLHLVALPEYHTGAMENWGAIASREDYVLLDEKSSLDNLRHGAYVMAHEIAHQWFGDLVTMEWWDDLWLNESFATLMETKMVDRLHPEWEAWDDFVRTDVLGAMRTDALMATHPIQARVRTAEEAGHVFDNISYGKGAAVLRMVEAYIGESAFRRGVSDYLRRFSYSNARGRDLWLSLETASGRPVSRIMRDWVVKPGFPVVAVKREGHHLTFAQSRFTLSGEGKGGRWPVPLTLELNGRKKSILLEGEKLSVEAPELRTLSVNAGHVGYYAVFYDEACRDVIAANFPALDPATRGGMLGDLSLFLLAGRVTPETYFGFVKLCRSSEDNFAVNLVTEQLGRLNAIAGEAEPVRSEALQFLRSQTRRLGLSPRPKEDSNVTTLRERVTTQLAMMDVAFARRLAKGFEGYRELDPNQRLPVLVGFAVANGREAMGPLLEMAKSIQDEAERTAVYEALMSSRDEAVLEETLEFGISGKVSRSDSGSILAAGAENPFAREALFRWVDRRYEKLAGIFAGSQQFYLFIDRALSVCGVGQEEAVVRFLSSARTRKGELTFRMTRELLAANERLRRRLLALGHHDQEHRERATGP